MRFIGLVSCFLVTITPVLAADWSVGQAYTYDGSGNIKQIGTDQQSYDGAQRLLTSSTNGIVRTHGYDKYGNYIDCAQAGGTDCQPYDVSTSNNRLTAATYDNAGNVTNFSGHAYTYDAANMQSSDVNGSLITEYIYTAGDERIAVYVPNTGSWRWTLRDASGKVLRELRSQNPASGTIGTGSWSWVKDYVWREGLLLASRQIEPGAATPVTYNYHLDRLGTARVITDASDQVVGAHEYYPYGDEQSGGQNEASLTPLKFTGHERDPDLDYMHARYYDWRRGRFLSVDPIWDSADLRRPQTWNRYAYVENNPVNRTDPTGKCGLPWASIVDCQTWLAIHGLLFDLKDAPRHFFENSSVGNQFYGAAYGDERRLRFGQVQALHEALTLGLVANMEMTTESETVDTTLMGEAWVSPEAMGTMIGSRVAGNASGKMSTIASEVTAAKMSQANAATAVNSAVQATGLRTTGVVKVGQDLVVGSVAPGTGRPVMVIDAQGVVRQASATIEVTKKLEVVVSDVHSH